MSGPLLLLGPQRPTPNLPALLETLPAGPVVTITAGWRHDESDARALNDAAGGDATTLPLYAWFEEILTAAPGLAEVYRARQARIRKLKELYRMRLRPAVETLRAMLPLQASDRALVRPELMDAVDGLRRLDARFLERSAEIQAAFAERLRSLEPPLVQRRRAEVRARLAGASAALIAGGHVAVLRNRLLFFELDRALAAARADGTAVIAWSAGAMALSDRIVLFHDDPPEGPSVPELLDRGLGLAPGIVALPHARRRLRLDDADRVAIVAARFAPAVCVGLENGAALRWQGGELASRPASASAEPTRDTQGGELASRPASASAEPTRDTQGGELASRPASPSAEPTRGPQGGELASRPASASAEPTRGPQGERWRSEGDANDALLLTRSGAVAPLVAALEGAVHA